MAQLDLLRPLNPSIRHCDDIRLATPLHLPSDDERSSERIPIRRLWRPSLPNMVVQASCGVLPHPSDHEDRRYCGPGALPLAHEGWKLAPQLDGREELPPSHLVSRHRPRDLIPVSHQPVLFLAT